jgi:hypothetical protein
VTVVGVVTDVVDVAVTVVAVGDVAVADVVVQPAPPEHVEAQWSLAKSNAGHRMAQSAQLTSCGSPAACAAAANAASSSELQSVAVVTVVGVVTVFVSVVVIVVVVVVTVRVVVDDVAVVVVVVVPVVAVVVVLHGLSREHVCGQYVRTNSTAGHRDSAWLQFVNCKPNVMAARAKPTLSSGVPHAVSVVRVVGVVRVAVVSVVTDVVVEAVAVVAVDDVVVVDVVVQPAAPEHVEMQWSLTKSNAGHRMAQSEQ